MNHAGETICREIFNNIFYYVLMFQIRKKCAEFRNIYICVYKGQCCQFPFNSAQ